VYNDRFEVDTLDILQVEDILLEVGMDGILLEVDTLDIQLEDKIEEDSLLLSHEEDIQ
jgi:hypothetical protein